MGQKTHPVGFRLQINKDWRSTWFAGKSFTSGLEGDLRIRKYIKARLPNAGISRVEISRSSKTVTVTIHTARPGIIIGKMIFHNMNILLLISIEMLLDKRLARKEKSIQSGTISTSILPSH